MFDFFRDLFDRIFGDDDDEETFSWGGDDYTFSPGVEDAFSLGDRIIEDPTGGEFVQEFYDLQAALDYVDGTPENVLSLVLDPEENIYYVYRFPSD